MGKDCFGLRPPKKVQHCRREWENVKEMHSARLEKAVMEKESRVFAIIKKKPKGRIDSSS